MHCFHSEKNARLRRAMASGQRVQSGQRSHAGWHQDAGSPDHSGGRAGRGSRCSSRTMRRTADGADGLRSSVQRSGRPPGPSRSPPVSNRWRLDGALPGLPGPGRHDRRAIVFGHVGIGPVERWFAEAGFGHAGLQIVANHLCGHPAKTGEGAAMRPDPVCRFSLPIQSADPVCRSSLAGAGSSSPRHRSGSRRQARPRTTGPDEPRPWRHR